MKQFFKAIWWFINNALWIYWVHPKQFYKFGGKWHRRKPETIILTDRFSISQLYLDHSAIAVHEQIREITKEREFMLRERMRMMGPFIQKWIRDCQLEKLPKTGDHNDFLLRSEGLIRRWL